jgi:probable phosphoglycerate mutase
MGAWLAHVANPWAGADHPEATFLGGERFVDFAARVVPAFEAILADPGWRNLLLVLHGAVNRMIFNYVLSTPWQRRMSIEQDNGCINIIDIDSAEDGSTERFLIRGINLTAYDLNKSRIRLTTMEQAAQRLAEQLGADRLL